MRKFIRKFIPVLALLVTACGGESFSAFGTPEEADGGTQDAVAEIDSGAGGSGGATVAASGGSTAQETDSGASTGGVSTGGATGATGGATSTGGTTATGGVTNTGGATATGGTTSCALVTHSNGIGQTWQDCVALYTYDKDQATKACEASGAAICSPSQNCGPLEITGYTANFGQVVGRWGYSSSFSGLVNACYANIPTHWT